jgi:glucoamylase
VVNLTMQFRKISTTTLTTCVLVSGIFTSLPAFGANLSSWLQTQEGQSINLMLANISPAGTAKGVVVAAPQQQAVNYYYHWVRDAGLTMDVVIGLYAQATDDNQKAQYLQILSDYVGFSSDIQQTQNRSGNPWDTGPGEPKFHVHGSVFTGDWGRPQNDGPAIRASGLIRLGHMLIDQGEMNWVQTNLYQSTASATTLLKNDLEFVAHHWGDPSFDLWEEVKGTHFYTRMVQRRALVEGAEFADRMGDGGAAAYYRAQAQQIEQQLANHWDDQKDYLVESLDVDPNDARNNSKNGMDVAVVLGALHGTIVHHDPSVATADEVLFSLIDDRIIITAERLKETFQSEFPVNSTGSGLAPGIGRYPNDTYDGYKTNSQGNPWFLATNAFAELYYRTANLIQAKQTVSVTPVIAFWINQLPQGSAVGLQQGETLGSSDARFARLLAVIRQGGDQFLKRTQFHSDNSGDLAEEFNYQTGFMQGAQNLTWSHASLITASWARSNQYQ